jgi:indolepyruvate ferredoxin oxidoreductase beta subunit
MSRDIKVMVTGVGGQGVIYLVDLLVCAATRSGIMVSTSEVHGLSQRGGSVNAGVTFGENTFGFVDQGEADYLIGLEFLEAQRHLSYLHSLSYAVIDNTRILPFSVSSEASTYPDTPELLAFLEEQIARVILIEDQLEEVNPLHRHLFVLGKATTLEGFPLTSHAIEKAIEEITRPALQEQNITLFRQGCGTDAGIKRQRAQGGQGDQTARSIV